MKLIIKLTAAVILFATFAAAQHTSHNAPATPAGPKPIELVTTDAITHKTVATQNKEAQAFFDQGLTLYYAFNDGDAVRSFRRAAEIDPQLAMAHWGIALAAYPRPTGGGSRSDKDRAKQASEAIKVAMSIPSPPADRVYIAALSKLFSDDSAVTRATLEPAYSEAMKSIYKDSPDDPDAAALYAMSIFYSQSFPFWRDGKPLGNVEKMVDVLERALKAYPKHLGLTHILIHAVEESDRPERAMAAADALRGLRIFTPSFGHLVHMPAHIYVRTGNFHLSVDSNEETAKMPTETLTDEFRGWHYNHVLSFLLYSYSMQGNFAKTSNTLERTFGFKTARSNDQRPRYLVRFRRWDDILSVPAPAADTKPNDLYTWSWARALAFIAKGDLVKAETERAAMASSASAAVFSTVRSIDDARIDAALKSAGGDRRSEIEHLKKAVTVEDTLPYSEPPYSISPVREALGGALLRDGQNAEAESVFREDLRRNPGNGRSLFGLMTALEAQNKKDEAKKTRTAFLKAWSYADIKLTVEDL